MVIGFYGDDSTDHPERQMQTAGAVFGWPGDVFEAERLWNNHLEKANIRYFRASECEMLMGEFDPVKLGMNLSSARAFAEATRRDMVSVLEQIPLTAVAVGLHLKDFKRVISSNPKALYYYGSDSTILVYGRLIKSTIELMHQDYPEFVHHTIAFTFDDHTNHLQAEAAYLQLKRKDSYCASMMGYVGHADDKLHAPLQMADLIAHEARHKCVAMLADSPKERSAFKLLSESHSIYYIGVMAENGLLSQLGEYPDPPADGSSNEFRWVLE